MDQPNQPGVPAPEPAHPKKSRLGLWIGLGIGIILLCCIAACVVVYLERANIPGLQDIFASGPQAMQAEDDNWLVRLDEVRTSTETISDSQGNSISPTSGYTFLIVKTTLVSKSADSQTVTISTDFSDAVITDSTGKDYFLAGLLRDLDTTLNMPGTINKLFFYQDAPDGQTVEFVFCIPDGTEVVSFQFKDLTPLSPLPMP